MSKTPRLAAHGVAWSKFFNLRPLIEEFGISATDDAKLEASSKLSTAIKLYCAHREHLPPDMKVFRAEVRRLEEKLSDFLKTAESVSPSTTIHVDFEAGSSLLMQRKQLAAILLALTRIRRQEASPGPDFVDAAGNKFVSSLVAPFRLLTGRSPDWIDFDASADSEPRDDISISAFGRFVLATEAVVLEAMAARLKSAEVAGATTLPATDYRLNARRASMRWAKQHARAARRTQSTAN